MLVDMVDKMNTREKYSIEEVWAAVAAADRINGNAFYGPNSLSIESGTKYNKTIALELLGSSNQNITAEDRELGIKLSEHFSGLLFTALSGPIHNNFIANVTKIIGKKLVTTGDIAYLAPLVRSYYRDLERESNKEEQQKLITTSSNIGDVGDRVQMVIRLLDSFYSRNYNIYIYTATDEKNLIKFTSAKGDETFRVGDTIDIKASIKKHQTNIKTGICETWLTRVKRIGNE